MIRCFRHGYSLAIVGLALAMGGSARAETRKNLATALDYAGFDLIGQRNPLSGGIDFLATNTFNGTPINFGAADLSLSGPLSLQVTTGGRFLSQFDVSLTTAVNGHSNATPLSYVYNLDLGNQSTQVKGSVLVDANFSFNALGFYDMSLTYSSRQDTTTNGQPAGNGTTRDIDVGPINISGNLYADLLAAFTDPLFQQAGRTNPFDSLSGHAQLQNLMRASVLDAQNALATGSDLTAASTRYAASEFGFGNGGTPPGIAFGRGNGGAVPEPAVLVLMLLGIPAIVTRPRRHL